MGVYVETPFNTGKARWLCMEHGAVITLKPDSLQMVPADNKVLLCVVRNGPFDAAAVVYNDQELRAFSDPRDGRSRTWLLMDRDALFGMLSKMNQTYLKSVGW